MYTTKTEHSHHRSSVESSIWDNAKERGNCPKVQVHIKVDKSVNMFTDLLASHHFLCDTSKLVSVGQDIFPTIDKFMVLLFYNTQYHPLTCRTQSRACCPAAQTILTPGCGTTSTACCRCGAWVWPTGRTLTGTRTRPRPTSWSRSVCCWCKTPPVPPTPPAV